MNGPYIDYDMRKLVDIMASACDTINGTPGLDEGLHVGRFWNDGNAVHAEYFYKDFPNGFVVSWHRPEIESNASLRQLLSLIRAKIQLAFASWQSECSAPAGTIREVEEAIR